MSRRLATLIAALLIASACASSPSQPPSTQSPSIPSPTPSAPSESPSSIPITLRVAPANLGCDAMGVPYRSVTFRIDATAAEQVIAVADDGTSLLTYWSEGFAGGSSGDPVVRDPAGSVVARDGDVLAIPEGASPRLAGYFVCPSADAIYVLLVDPQ